MRYALLLIDSEDKTEFLDTYLRKNEMDARYRLLKNRGVSNLHRAKIEIVITKVYP